MWRSQPSERILVWRLMIEVNKEISAESAFTTLTLSDLMLRMKYPPLEGAMGFTRNLNCTTESWIRIYLFIYWNENKTFLVNFGWASLPWVNSSHLFWFWVMFPTERKGIFCVLWLLRTEDVSELDKWRGTSGDLRPVARTAPGARAGKVPGNSEICLCRFHLGQGRADLPCNEFLPALKKSFMCNV